MSVTPAESDKTVRNRNPRGQGDRLRVDLLKSAAELIAQEGSVDRVSLRAIAARAGVSPTAVYRHFDDHEQLLEATILHCWNRFDSALESAADPTIDPFIEFRNVGGAYVEFAKTNPGMYRTLFDTHTSMGDAVREASLHVFIKLVTRVERLLAANEDDREPFFVATEVHTWLHGIVDICTDDPDGLFPSIDSLVDDLGVRLGLVAATAD